MVFCNTNALGSLTQVVCHGREQRACFQHILQRKQGPSLSPTPQCPLSGEKAASLGLGLGRGLACPLLLRPGPSPPHLLVPGSGAWRGGRGPLRDQNYNSEEKQPRTTTDHHAPTPCVGLLHAPLGPIAVPGSSPGFVGSLSVLPGRDHHVLSSQPSTRSTFSQTAPLRAFRDGSSTRRSLETARNEERAWEPRGGLTASSKALASSVTAGSSPMSGPL